MGNKYLDSWDDFEAHRSGKSTGGSLIPFDGVSSSKHVKKKSSLSDHGHGSGERCYHKHPALKLPGTELVIYGGSCSSPAVHDADVYIGFDHGMKFTARHWPWRKGDELLFEITDMSAPKNVADFRALVTWTKIQLEAGRKVHAGCIGGHGRTGTFFAALVSEFGEKDAIAYVRKHYCDKAVESGAQIAFLKEHFDVTPVKASKSCFDSGHGSANKAAGQGGKGSYKCVDSPSCIWGAP